jgi:uncharacterized membrane protein
LARRGGNTDDAVEIFDGVLASHEAGGDARPVVDTTPSPVAFNDSDLVALTTLPPAVLVAAAMALVAAVALSWLSTRGAPQRLRIGLLALRVLLVVAVFVVLLEPGRRLLATSREPDRVVIAVDTSASMSVGEGDKQRSRQAARAALAVVDDVTAREPALVPEVWFFDDAFTAKNIDDLKGLRDGVVTATGPASRLALPIERAEQQQQNTSSPTPSLPLGGVVVISDGADTTGMPINLTADLRERLSSLGAPQPVPVHTVVVGTEDAFKDVVLERAIADEFAFVRNPMTVEVVIRQRGFTGTSLPLTLAEDGVVVARTDVVLTDKADDGKELRARFTFAPQRAGKRLYTVQAPVLDGEAIAENNRVDFTVKLIRDRIRVLQVAGRPSWDERFVRRLLKENPSVDLISFFILRSTTDISGAANNELSLIPFPTRELFTEQLSTFDVVIFQDFNYRPYNMGVYLQNVADYVKGGGGFLMMGGDLSFAEGEYADTPLAEVLPVTLRAGSGHLDTEDFTPVVTDAGRRHPITDVAGTVDGAAGANIFAQLPQLQGLNLSAGLQPGATALLTHPFVNTDDGTPQPVIAVRDVEKGRSVAITTDTTWHWSLPQVGLGGGRGDAHRKLLANTLRWLIRDPELSRVKLSLDADARGVEPGAAVTALVAAQNANYQPEEGANVVVTLVPLDADARGNGAALVPPAPVVTAADGLARVVLHPDRAGAWRVKVEVTKDGNLVGVDENVFVVRTASLERLHAEARPDILAAMAGASGGRAVDVESVTGLPFVDHGRMRVHRQKTEPLWNSAWALAGVVVLAGLEWWWRRRRGFA